MCDRMNIANLTQVMEAPPTRDFIGDGGLVKEECLLIATIYVGSDRRRLLDDLGINMTWADYDPESDRWDHCLLSEGAADLLEDLHATGDFPYYFEAGPSKGGLAWLAATDRGSRKRPELSLALYLTPASADELDAFAQRASSSRPRRLERS